MPDGTLVRLNVGAEIESDFTAAVRGVRLIRGEAHFTVTKDSARPFNVEAGGVTVHAVGTAFNVRLQAHAVDVLVTEGTVQVTPPVATANPPPSSAATKREESGRGDPLSPYVVQGQRAVVPLTLPPSGPAVTVSGVTPEEISQALAWREPLLRLGGATLAQIAEEFQRQTGVRLVLTDPELAELHVGGRFRSDDIEGFMRILRETYGIESGRGADGTFYIGKSP